MKDLDLKIKELEKELLIEEEKFLNDLLVYKQSQEQLEKFKNHMNANRSDSSKINPTDLAISRVRKLKIDGKWTITDRSAVEEFVRNILTIMATHDAPTAQQVDGALTALNNANPLAKPLVANTNTNTVNDTTTTTIDSLDVQLGIAGHGGSANSALAINSVAGQPGPTKYSPQWFHRWFKRYQYYARTNQAIAELFGDIAQECPVLFEIGVSRKEVMPGVVLDETSWVEKYYPDLAKFQSYLYSLFTRKAKSDHAGHYLISLPIVVPSKVDFNPVTFIEFFEALFPKERSENKLFHRGVGKDLRLTKGKNDYSTHEINFDCLYLTNQYMDPYPDGQKQNTDIVDVWYIDNGNGIYSLATEKESKSFKTSANFYVEPATGKKVYYKKMGYWKLPTTQGLTGVVSLYWQVMDTDTTYGQTPVVKMRDWLRDNYSKMSPERAVMWRLIDTDKYPYPKNYIWDSEKRRFKKLPGKPSYAKINELKQEIFAIKSGERNKATEEKKQWWKYPLTFSGGFLLAICLGFFFFGWRKKRKE